MNPKAEFLEEERFKKEGIKDEDIPPWEEEIIDEEELAKEFTKEEEEKILRDWEKDYGELSDEDKEEILRRERRLKRMDRISTERIRQLEIQQDREEGWYVPEDDNREYKEVYIDGVLFEVLTEEEEARVRAEKEAEEEAKREIDESVEEPRIKDVNDLWMACLRKFERDREKAMELFKQHLEYMQKEADSWAVVKENGELGSNLVGFLISSIGEYPEGRGNIAVDMIRIIHEIANIENPLEIDRWTHVLHDTLKDMNFPIRMDTLRSQVKRAIEEKTKKEKVLKKEEEEQKGKLTLEEIQKEVPFIVEPALDFMKADEDFACVSVLRSYFTSEGLIVHVPTMIFSDRSMTRLTDETVMVPYKNSRLQILAIPEFSESTPLIDRWSKDDVIKFCKKEDEEPKMVDILQNCIDIFNDYIDFGQENIEFILSLWIMGTYVYKLFPVYPYIFLHGETGSGKTAVLNILRELCFNAESIISTTPAALFRIANTCSPTLLIDEAENLVGKETDKEILALLNSGYKQGDQAKRVEKIKDDNFTIKSFSVYCPKAIANIRGIPQTIRGRSIEIIMTKTIRKDTIKRELLFEISCNASRWQKLRDKLYRFIFYYFKDIYKEYQNMMIGDDNNRIRSDFLGRDLEIWKPLFAIAKVIDNEQPGFFEIVLNTARRLIHRKQIDDLEYGDNSHILILQAIQNLIDNEKRDWRKGRMTSKDITKEIEIIQGFDVAKEEKVSVYKINSFLKKNRLNINPTGKRPKNLIQYHITQNMLNKVLEIKGINLKEDEEDEEDEEVKS